MGLGFRSCVYRLCPSFFVRMGASGSGEWTYPDCVDHLVRFFGFDTTVSGDVHIAFWDEDIAIRHGGLVHDVLYKSR
jgi:hypothetical protein